MNKEEQKLFSIISDKMKDLAKILKSINTGIEQTKCQFYKYKINDLAKTITYEDLGFVKTILNNVINQQGLSNKPWNTRSLYNTEDFDFNDVNFLTLAQTKNLYDFLDATFNGESFHKIVNDFVENVYEDDYDLHEYHGTSFLCCNIKNEKQLYDIINTDWSGPKNLFSVIPEYVDFALNDGKVEFHFNNIYKEIFSFTCEGNTIQTFSDGKPGKTFEFNSKNIQLVLHDVYDYAANIEKDFYSEKLYNMSLDKNGEIVEAFCWASKYVGNEQGNGWPNTKAGIASYFAPIQLENITVFLSSLTKENLEKFANSFVTKNDFHDEKYNDPKDEKLFGMIFNHDWSDQRDFLKALPKNALPFVDGESVRFGIEGDLLHTIAFAYEGGAIRTYIDHKPDKIFERKGSEYTEEDLQDIEKYLVEKLASRISKVFIEEIEEKSTDTHITSELKKFCTKKINEKFGTPLDEKITGKFLEDFVKNEKIQSLFDAEREAAKNNKVDALEEK